LVISDVVHNCELVKIIRSWNTNNWMQSRILPVLYMFESIAFS